MDDEMKAARAAWWSVVNWDHLDELTACEAWDAAERVHRAIVADIPGEAERDALHMRLAAAEDANAACNADCARVRAERDALRAEAAALWSAIRWALGENGNFSDEPYRCQASVALRYWWRAELRRRADAARAGGEDA